VVINKLLANICMLETKRMPAAAAAAAAIEQR
jgi:hypothetical protein